MYTGLATRPAPTRIAPRRLRGLDRVIRAGSILGAIRNAHLAAEEIGVDAARSSAAARNAVAHLIAHTRQADDALLSIAAVHALAAIPGADADSALIAALESPNLALPAHVAWVASSRSVSGPLLESIVRLQSRGGLAGMHAQAALAGWAARDPWLVAAAVRAELHRSGIVSPARHHLVETLGLVPDHSVGHELEGIALDPAEQESVRCAAIAALGDRHAGLPSAVARLALGTGPVADSARLAASVSAAPRTRSPGRGVNVAQVHLGGELDPELRHSGVGNTGGVATLLVKLGSALVDTPGIERVLTIGRSSKGTIDIAGRSISGPRYASVALSEGQGNAFSDAWPARIAAARGIRRVLALNEKPDVIHLRMADVGTLAAAEVAARSGIPTVFTLAPDPHAMIAAREAEGTLDRTTFAGEDSAAHLWYRVKLVDRLAAEAREVVLFPRPHLHDEIEALLGIDLAGNPHRYTVVPEGVDVGHIRRAVAARGRGGRERERERERGKTGTSEALSDLLNRIAELPLARHGLPIVLSVGRLNELKGMARLVEAFGLDGALRDRANLVIVGGDLENPIPEERAELARIARVTAAHPGLDETVVLLGHRPNGEVADLLGAARHGAAGFIGRGGAYACASRKEEFGLAIVEALAAGLPVVAPLLGGPATYIQSGKTGVLVNTAEPFALARGITDALDLSDSPGRADAAAAAIAQRYDISEMARALSRVYRRAAAPQTERLAS